MVKSNSSVNLSVYHLIMHTQKKGQPIFIHVLVYNFFTTGEIVTKLSVLSLIYCIVLSMILFHMKNEYDDDLVLRTYRLLDTKYRHLLILNAYHHHHFLLSMKK